MTDGKKRNSKEDRAKECPAMKNNLKCNKCGKPNHMEKVCQSTESKSGGGDAKTPPPTNNDAKASAGAASTENSPSHSTEDLLWEENLDGYQNMEPNTQSKPHTQEEEMPSVDKWWETKPSKRWKEHVEQDAQQHA